MKNVLFTCLMLTAVLASAQFTGERERNMRDVSNTADAIANSNAPIEQREAQMAKLLSDYMSSIASHAAEKQLESVLHDMKAQKCSATKVKSYLEQFVGDQKKVLTEEYLRVKGLKSDDCAVQSAVKIYTIVGDDKVAERNICQIIRCDENTEIRHNTRGEKELWLYTGEKRFITEADNRMGWRYKCVRVKKVEEKDESAAADGGVAIGGANGRENDATDRGSFGDDAITPPAGYDFVAGTEPEWKIRELVDFWY